MQSQATAAQVTPASAPSRAVCHALCLLPRGALSLRSAHRRASAPQTPPSAKVQPRRGRPVRCSGPHEAALRQPARARHAARPLRSRSASRARPDQTGGDPAAPIGCRIASTAAEAGDRSLTLGNRQAAGRRCAALRRRPRLARASRARGGRMAPRCAKPQARPEESGQRNKKETRDRLILLERTSDFIPN